MVMGAGGHIPCSHQPAMLSAVSVPDACKVMGGRGGRVMEPGTLKERLNVKLMLKMEMADGVGQVGHLHPRTDRDLERDARCKCAASSLTEVAHMATHVDGCIHRSHRTNRQGRFGAVSVMIADLDTAVGLGAWRIGCCTGGVVLSCVVEVQLDEHFLTFRILHCRGVMEQCIGED